MEKLLTPDFGLTFWTLINFAILIIVLAKTAWKPLLKAVDDYETELKKNRETALEARTAAEALKQEAEKALENLATSAHAKIKETENIANERKESILKTAQEEASKIAEKAKQEIQLEKQKVIAELRSEVAALSVSISEKILGREIDKKTNEGLVSSLLNDLGNKQKK